MTIDPPNHDEIFYDEIPEKDYHREYSEFVVGLMEAWRTSKPETEKRMEQYSLEQCEWLLHKRWENGR